MNNEGLYNQPVVIDNGTGVLKVGFVGDDKPKCFQHNIVGTPKFDKVMIGGLDDNMYIGNKAQENRGLLRLRHPMEHGEVKHWDEMEAVWKHTLLHDLNIQHIEEHPILITEAPLNSSKNREHMCEILFESFNIPAIHVENPAVLALYSGGRTTGCVIDCGEGYCSAVPIYEGFALTPSIRRIDIGGREITEQLQFQIRKSVGMSLFSSNEKEIVRTIKERACYVADDISKEEHKYILDSESNSSKFKLPDGKSLSIGNVRFRATELLFNPRLIGCESDSVPEIVFQTLSRVDIDLRPMLYKSLVLNGGTTVLPGFGNRILKELQILTKQDTKLRIIASPERKYTTWIGGSILAGLSTFQKILVTKSNWNEDRSRVYSSF
ncbi:hypothetical protein TPHA_0I01300 [Tetrapisispora phaffii CBS 4417]|uniref:Centractin n=1 Tax=Tetrapisispora phaffii (strain ATCC 24235 / CBS 4417 / NBRC 1672 / NRRL Y-8282 / UCD 70-5) TaxID=1071381 RepID=G8BXK9_TETPH|nr:hypothetical protein TPHA_0I01300 [Tetrapisispora phaffii CBS 4417]CCE64637.1 hypothetical protein TPHA_0I01300 [Tetrapisispora phaffii CBS 4417]